MPLDFGELTAAELIDYNEALLANGSPLRSHHFSNMRVMLRAVAARAGERMQSGLVERINSVKAPRSREGHAVRTQDPQKGALTSGEVNALRAGANEGRGTELQRTLLRLCLETGMYGEAISDLKATDIRHEEVEELDRATGRMKGVRRWILDRPRVKKGTQHRETRELYLTAALGEALHARSHGGPYLVPEVRSDFPNREISKQLTAYARELSVLNERTGEPLRLSTRRFRYTLGTELAADGHEAETIANILDHGHIKEAKAYIEVSRRLVKRVNAMIAPEAERFLKRFRGRVEGQEEPRNRTLPVILNQGPSLDSDGLSGIGGCGAGTLCELAWPLSCYACDRFIAWGDADHEGVLANLVERRTLFEEQGDTRVARQLDEVVLAVKDVIAEVERRRAEVGS
jgi:integrase